MKSTRVVTFSMNTFSVLSHCKPTPPSAAMVSLCLFKICWQFLQIQLRSFLFRMTSPTQQPEWSCERFWVRNSFDSIPFHSIHIYWEGLQELREAYLANRCEANALANLQKLTEIDPDLVPELVHLNFIFIKPDVFTLLFAYSAYKQVSRM